MTQPTTINYYCGECGESIEWQDESQRGWLHSKTLVPVAACEEPEPRPSIEYLN